MKTALEQYEEIMAECEPEDDPIERLRFFLSLCGMGQGWLDVEPFIDDVIAEREFLCQQNKMLRAMVVSMGVVEGSNDETTST